VRTRLASFRSGIATRVNAAVERIVGGSAKAVRACSLSCGLISV